MDGEELIKLRRVSKYVCSNFDAEFLIRKFLDESFSSDYFIERLERPVLPAAHCARLNAHNRRVKEESGIDRFICVLFCVLCGIFNEGWQLSDAREWVLPSRNVDVALWRFRAM